MILFSDFEQMTAAVLLCALFAAACNRSVLRYLDRKIRGTAHSPSAPTGKAPHCRSRTSLESGQAKGKADPRKTK